LIADNPARANLENSMIQAHPETLAATGERGAAGNIPDIPALRDSVHGAGGLLASLFAGWRLKQDALRLASEMLEHYHRVARAQPGLCRDALYRAILLERFGGDGDAAARTMRHADECFARWPTQRDLVYRDIVQFLAINDPRANQGNGLGSRTRFGRIAAGHIPVTL
jgi:hypothetical protein